MHRWVRVGEVRHPLRDKVPMHVHMLHSAAGVRHAPGHPLHEGTTFAAEQVSSHRREEKGGEDTLDETIRRPCHVDTTSSPVKSSHHIQASQGISMSGRSSQGLQSTPPESGPSPWRLIHQVGVN